MQILAIQGSPRKKGNTTYLLHRLLDACEDMGAQTREIRACDLEIHPCKELLLCETKGICPLKDEMEGRYYGWLYRADVVILASPVFFYNVSAQAKTLIDRCQMFWGRRYKLGLKDPRQGRRRGVLISVAASRGKRLFEGVELTARYFFDALSMELGHRLTLRNLEGPSDARRLPGIQDEIQALAKALTAPLRDPDQLVFVSKTDAAVGKAAAAFAQCHPTRRVQVHSAGTQAASRVDEGMVSAMADQGLDLKYARPRSLDDLIARQFRLHPPRWTVVLDGEIPLDVVPDGKGMYLDLDLPRMGDRQWAESLRSRVWQWMEDRIPVGEIR